MKMVMVLMCSLLGQAAFAADVVAVFSCKGPYLNTQGQVTGKGGSLVTVSDDGSAIWSQGQSQTTIQLVSKGVDQSKTAQVFATSAPGSNLSLWILNAALESKVGAPAYLYLLSQNEAQGTAQYTLLCSVAAR